MDRRDVLRASGATLIATFTGCTDKINSGDWSTTTTDGATTTEVRKTEPRETTTTTTTIGPAKTRYNTGTAHVHAEWKFAVAEFELRKQFQTDNGETYVTPGPKQLGIATITVTNLASDKRGWSEVDLAVIFDGTAYERQRGFDHPAFSDYVVMDELKGIETARQYAPSAYPVEPDETVTTWELFVLPEDATRNRVSVGFDGTSDDGTTYPVRWALS